MFFFKLDEKKICLAFVIGSGWRMCAGKSSLESGIYDGTVSCLVVVSFPYGSFSDSVDGLLSISISSSGLPMRDGVEMRSGARSNYDFSGISTRVTVDRLQIVNNGVVVSTSRKRKDL
ncbi:MAG: hypothetical protein ABIG28_02770 [archaeon]